MIILKSIPLHTSLSKFIKAINLSSEARQHCVIDADEFDADNEVDVMIDYTAVIYNLWHAMNSFGCSCF